MTMRNQPKPMTEQDIDKSIRIMRMARLYLIIVLAIAAPVLYALDVITEDNIVWFSVGFAFMAISDWFVIGTVIKRMEKSREQIR